MLTACDVCIFAGGCSTCDALDKEAEFQAEQQLRADIAVDKAGEEWMEKYNAGELDMDGFC
jgi:Fe-S cluster biogenesis protein NfuA